MSEQGWITIHRSIREHWLYEEKRAFSKYEAWIDLLMDANHTSKKTLIDGQLEEVNRGQNITSIRKLCVRWNWSNNKVTRFLNLLQEDGMIIWKSDTKKTAITIVNYDFYQSGQNEKASPSFQPRIVGDSNVNEKSIGEASGSNSMVPSDTDYSGNTKASRKHIKSTSDAYQKHTNNNVNNGNNEKNNNNNGVYPAELIQSLYGKFPSGILQGAIADWLQTWPREMICFAIQTSFDYGKELNALKPYINRILDNWSSVGIDTVEKAIEANNQFKQRQTRQSKPNGFGKKVRKETLPDHITNPVVDTEEDPAVKAELEQRLAEYLKKKEAMASEEQ